MMTMFNVNRCPPGRRREDLLSIIDNGEAMRAASAASDSAERL
jgi:hypothetical protein